MNDSTSELGSVDVSLRYSNSRMDAVNLAIMGQGCSDTQAVLNGREFHVRNSDCHYRPNFPANHCCSQTRILQTWTDALQLHGLC